MLKLRGEIVRLLIGPRIVGDPTAANVRRLDDHLDLAFRTWLYMSIGGGIAVALLGMADRRTSADIAFFFVSGPMVLTVLNTMHAKAMDIAFWRYADERPWSVPWRIARPGHIEVPIVWICAALTTWWIFSQRS